MKPDLELPIIEKAKHDPEAFGILFDEYYSQIFNYALKRTASVHIAQDVTSEVFIKALQNLHKYKYRGFPLSSWLYRITGNEIANYYNQNNSDKLTAKLILNFQETIQPSVEEELIEAEEEVSKHREYLALHESISKLPTKYQEVITLRYFENMQLKEISHILEKKEGTVKSLLHRGLEKMRELMENMQPFEDTVVIQSRGQS